MAAAPAGFSRNHGPALSSRQQAATLAVTLSDSDVEQEGTNQGVESEAELELDINPEEAPETLDNEQLVKSGYLYKRQVRNMRGKHWKKRWFVLRSTKLAYYKDEKEYELIGIIDMNDVHTIAEVTVKNKPNVFGIVLPNRTYYIKTDAREELDSWLAVLNQVKSQVQGEELINTTREEEQDDEGSQADSEDMATKRPATAKRRGTRFALRGQLKLKAPLQATHSMLDSPLATSPQALTHAIDIPGARKPNDMAPPPPIQDATGHSYTSASSYTSQVSIPNQPSSPTSPVADYASPIEHKDSSDPTVSSEEDEEYVNVSKDYIEKLGEINRVIHQGYLLKLGKYRKWKKRWFVLGNSSLVYYKSQKQQPNLVIPLSVVLDAIEVEPLSKSKQFCFKIITPERTFILCARNDENQVAWLGALQMALAKYKEKLKQEDSKNKQTAGVQPVAGPSSGSTGVE